MELPGWVPEGVEVTVPNAARMYDYALGGYHNFAVDREFVERAEELMPGAISSVYANRAFVRRAVRWLVNAGLRQFLDIGSGIPTLGNVHEVAQRMAPESRVIYVDIDPVAVAHSGAILADNPGTRVLWGDLRRPAEILYHPDVLGFLDFSQPVAVLLNAVLHFVSDDDDPAGILAQVRDALVAGSHLTITHGTPVPQRASEQERVRRLYQSTPTSVHFRTREQIRHMLADWELVEPGLVPVTDWRPDSDDDGVPPQPAILGAIARVPRP
jgi:S-adenosyl methyltransferase